MGPDEARGPRRGPHFLIGLIIIAVAVFLYFTHTEKNPITGESQHISLTPEQEIRLGIQSAPEMAAKMGGEEPSSDPHTQEVQKIGEKIVAESDAHKGPWRFQFHLLADPKTINAFALPGGQIFITLGLFNKLQTEGQLAGVLSHEIGHVIQRHSAQQMAKGQLGQLMVLATGVGAGESHGQQAVIIASLVNQMTQLHYSRKDELEADAWGLHLMSQAGYDPKAMLEVMKILKESAPGGHQPEMLQTHPYPERRMEAIREYLSKHPSRPGLTEGGALHHSF